MRRFVAALLRDEPFDDPPPPGLVRANLLGPIAYRRGIAAHQGDYAASVIMAARLAALARDVAAELARRDVRVALLKGMAYAGVLYPDPAERPMNDIDILVPSPQMPAARRCLDELGFACASGPRDLSGAHHAVTYVRSGMMIDLHRNIVQHGRTALRTEDLWRRAGPDPHFPGAERLHAVDALLVCALHIARHELAAPVLNYLDVARSWAALDDSGRDEMWQRARAYRVERPIKAVLSMTDLLRRGVDDRPHIGIGERLLPGSGEVLRARPPPRMRQIVRKVVLTDDLRSVAGLTAAYARDVVSGWRHRRLKPTPRATSPRTAFPP